jgi:2'-5' RNA ligase
MMRSFIAVELPDAIQQNVRQRQRQVQADLAQRSLTKLFNWTPVEKVHLTLRFFGETDERQAAALPVELEKVAQHSAPIKLMLTSLGCFPNPRQPRIIWLGMQGDLAALAALQAKIETLAQGLGFAPETRPFSPHLTIARLQRNAPRTSLVQAGQAIQSLASDPAFVAHTDPFLVQELTWMRSELLPEGARYTPLRYVTLG